jgi:hypothetical protein
MNDITYTVWYRHKTNSALSKVQGTYVKEMAIMNANLYNGIPDQPCDAIPLSVVFCTETQRWYYGTLDNVPAGR